MENETPRPKKKSFPIYYTVTDPDGATTELMIIIDPHEVGATFFDRGLIGKWQACVGAPMHEKPPEGVYGPWKVNSFVEVPRAPGPGACYEVAGQIYCW